jgi:hypothetical protein
MNDSSKIAGEIHKAAESKAAKIQENDYYKKLQEQLAQKADAQTLWAKGVDAKGATTYFINASSLAAQADFSTISTHVTSVKAPLSNRAILGMKIDFEEKSFTLKDLYMKAFIQSKSHNLIVAKLNGLKCAATGFLLSLLGSTSEELRKLQKKALGIAREENMRLYSENIYNLELLEIVGGANNKQNKAQEKVIREIVNQVTIQARHIGLGDYYTAEKITELKIEALKDILFKFKEEEMHLKYQLEYTG